MSRVLFALCLNSGSSGGSALVDMLVFGRPAVERRLFAQVLIFTKRRDTCLSSALLSSSTCWLSSVADFEFRSTDIIAVVVECA